MKLVKSSLVGVSMVPGSKEMAWVACSPEILPFKMKSRMIKKAGLEPARTKVSMTI